MREISIVIETLRKAKGKRKQDDLFIEWSIKELQKIEEDAIKSGSPINGADITRVIWQMLPWLLYVKTISIEELLDLFRDILR